VGGNVTESTLLETFAGLLQLERMTASRLAMIEARYVLYGRPYCMIPGKNTFCGLRRISHSDSIADPGTEWLLWDPFRILAPGSVIILFRSRSKSLPFVATSWSGVSVKR
jgi:hypothetical protein